MRIVALLALNLLLLVAGVALLLSYLDDRDQTARQMQGTRLPAHDVSPSPDSTAADQPGETSGTTAP